MLPTDCVPDSQIPLCSFCAWIFIGEDDENKERNSPDCSSCQLMTGALPINTFKKAAEEDETETQRVRMRPRKSKNGLRYGRIYDVHNHRGLGYMYMNAGYNKRPVDIPETIDFTTTKIWLKRCKDEHGMACGQLQLPSRYSTPIDIILVDVIEYCITAKTTASIYFALSYVWGGAVNTATTMHNHATHQQPGSLRDGQNLPKTVSDAILLTRKMGVRYLWVDCLSIIQDSPEKHNNIANMDIIYAQAELTIVALDGKDAKSGLPGVIQDSRRRRATSILQGTHVLELHMPTSKSDLLPETIYASRGWTFQELLISRRLLFVAEQQVVFHCGISKCAESFPEGKSYEAREFGFGIIDLNSKEHPKRRNNSIIDTYITMVQEYCVRRLSFQTDIEKAFAGLTSVLEQWCEGFPVIHGMMSNFFGCSMMWTIQEDQHYYSSYNAPEIFQRRESFPSWSWVGWIACISNICKYSNIKLPLNSLIRNVEITKIEKNSPARSFYVMDKSARERDKSLRQKIRINLVNALPNSNTMSISTLSFNAERTSWRNLTFEHSSAYSYVNTFRFWRGTSTCGILSIIPDQEITDKVSERTTKEGIDSVCDWSLVALYSLKLQPWDGVNDSLQELLSFIDMDNTDTLYSATALRARLQESRLVFVLLIRRSGIYWKRMGSGLMFARDWPSTDLDAEVRAYQERIVLI